MKDATTLNLIQNSKCSPFNRGLRQRQGVVCLLALTALFSSSLAVSDPLDSCVRRIEDHIEALSPTRALVVTDKIPTVSFKNAIQGRMPKVKNTPYFEFEVPDGGYVTVVNLSSPKVKRNHILSQALDLWNNHTYETYKRLPKYQNVTREELNALKIPERTVVIIKSKKSLNEGDPEILGGIRVVFARGKETLPFQAEIPEFVRAQNAAEPGRLTGSGFSPMMIHFSVGVIKQNPDITELVVHTSDGHATLYRRAGAATKDIHVKDEDNWLLRFGRMQIYQVLKKTRDKLTLSAG